MVSTSDDELMARVKQGDRNAFASLVDRHKNGLVGYLATLTRSRERAEELAQEAFLRVFVAAKQYREIGRFSPYLFRIALNLLRSEERRARRRRWLTLQIVPGKESAESDPQAELLRREASELVSRALAELPLPYRATLVLREIEGWSYRDIATVLGCGEGTVKSRIHRGREKLKEILAPYWNGDRP